MAEPLSPAEFEALLRATVESGRLADVVRVSMVETGLVAENRAKLAVTTGGASGLNSRSGHLRNSIRHTIEKGPTGPEMHLSAGGRFGGNDVRYARIHELGGTVVPKRAKLLALPSALMRTGAGVGRVPGPRDVPGLRFQPTPNSPKVVAVLVNEQNQVMFYLRKSVTIPARPYLRPSLDQSVQGFRARLGSAMAHALTPE